MKFNSNIYKYSISLIIMMQKKLYIFISTFSSSRESFFHYIKTIYLCYLIFSLKTFLLVFNVFSALVLLQKVVSQS